MKREVVIPPSLWDPSSLFSYSIIFHQPYRVLSLVCHALTLVLPRSSCLPTILFPFSVSFFVGMIGLHNAEEMGLQVHEACKTRFQSGEDIGLFLPWLCSCMIFLHVTSNFENNSFQLSRSRIPF
jgi:hypothetical protein